MNVLVVDDSQVMRNILIKKLQELGAAGIEQAVDGLEAMRKVSAKSYDMVILDILMPKADGLAVLKHIREVAPRTKVIMCSTVNSKETVMEAVKAGIDDYILKPYTLEKLEEVLLRKLR